MARLRTFLLVVIVFLLVLGGIGWWYLFGANKLSAAELVPSDTVAFATIPNGFELGVQYQNSRLKTLVEDPNVQPAIDKIHQTITDKNIDLLTAFLPLLSGQSFIALTHVDSDHPENIGFIAAMKPKPGLGDFDAFVDKVKAAYADEIKQGTTGQGNVAGLDYQWIQGPKAPDKICVAKLGGWIVTTWGEAPLQDWIERYHGKSTTPSLAQNPDYQKSLTRVGKTPMLLTYINAHALLDPLQKKTAKMNPAMSDYLNKKLAGIGGVAIGTSFEDGEIVDRFSSLMPPQLIADSGMAATPCPFDTLKFTGLNTRMYWGASFDAKQYWKNIQDQVSQVNSTMPISISPTAIMQAWAQTLGLDFQKNIIDPLGSEFSVQLEWNPGMLYPEVGVFVKLDKPDDFKPTINAIIAAVRKAYSNSAVITEMNSNGQNFATVEFVTQPLPVSPTITEDGDYFALFLTKNQAAASYHRDELAELPHNADFLRQIGDKRNGASALLFLDTPQLLNRGYQTVLPYVSMAAMFNSTLSSALQGHTLPPDLSWLAPMGTWSMVVTPDDSGLTGYSVSGVGNQGVFLMGGIGGAAQVAQSMGMIPKMGLNHSPIAPATVLPAPASTPALPPPAPAPATPPPATPAPAPTSTPPPPAPAPAPDVTTNAAPAASPESAPATNAVPSATPPPPDATTNATPAPVPAAATNSDVNPDSPKTQ